MEWGKEQTFTAFCPTERVLTFLSLAFSDIKRGGYRASTAEDLFFLTSLQIMPGHTNMVSQRSPPFSFLPFSFLFFYWSAFLRSAPRVTRKRVKGPLLLNSWPLFWLISLSYSFFLRQKRSHTKFGSFMQCIRGGPPSSSLSSNSMNNEWREEYEEGWLSIFRLQISEGGGWVKAYLTS